MSSPPMLEPNEPQRPAGESLWRRWWVWLVLALTAGVVATVGGMMIYNWMFRLTPERLQQAKERWRQAAYRDYDMVIDVTGGASGRYHVEVRDGHATRVTRNDEDLQTGDIGERRPATQEQRDAWSMPGLFRILQNDLEFDAKESKPGFTRAHFDSVDGHLIRYVRSSGRNQIVIEVVVFDPK